MDFSFHSKFHFVPWYALNYEMIFTNHVREKLMIVILFGWWWGKLGGGGGGQVRWSTG